VFILNRNQCSFWTGIGVQIGPEYALASSEVLTTPIRTIPPLLFVFEQRIRFFLFLNLLSNLLHRYLLSTLKDKSRNLPRIAWITRASTDKLTHTHGLELQNNCGDTIITDRWLHFERNFMQKEAGYSHFW